MKRHDFLNWLLGGTLVATGFAALRAAFEFITPPRSSPRSPTEAQLLAFVKELPKGAGKEVIFGNKPVWVIQDKRRNYKAFSAICTHLGCITE
jgi:Rieske Fe-S protein